VGWAELTGENRGRRRHPPHSHAAAAGRRLKRIDKMLTGNEHRRVEGAPQWELKKGLGMGCLGLHFSLDTAQVAALRAISEDERVEYVQEQFEEKLWSADPSRAQEMDKAWDAIHRSVSDGTLAWDAQYPLGHAILGGESLYGADDYILSLKSPGAVQDISAAIKDVARKQLREGYDRIDADAYGFSLNDEDFEYTWKWFQDMVTFYQRAALAGYSVLFTADQ
jgi:hypothetical protein